MKQVIIFLTVFAWATTTAIAQNVCSYGDPFFKFDNGAKAIEIHTLGANPEFPFLRNLTTPERVYLAIKRNENRVGKNAAVTKLNKTLIAIGFENGIADLQASNITAANVPSGSEGNMGTGDLVSGYYKLTGDPTGYKAWKISSPTGCYVDIFARCGNAFYPNPDAGKNTACINAPVNIVSTPREVTLTNQPVQVTNRTYVYYHVKKHRKHRTVNALAGVSDNNPSKPLLLGTTNSVQSHPETYRLSVSTPSTEINVCPDKAVDVAADINVEHESSFTGNYPDKSNDTYKKVSKRTYRRSSRKMHRVDKIEGKVGKLSGVPVTGNV